MTDLWKHQELAIERLGELGCGMLCFDVGTGKTLAALMLAERWQSRKVLIVCPHRVIPIWEGEFEKHGLTGYIVESLAEGSTARRAMFLAQTAEEADAAGRPFAAILNYQALLGQEMKSALAAVGWDCVVLDECQNIKGAGAKTSIFLGQLSRMVPHRLGLTGTPLHDTPLDAYAQMRAVAPQVLGMSWVQFKRRYGITIKEQLEADFLAHGQKQVLALNRMDPPLNEHDKKLVGKFGLYGVRLRNRGPLPNDLTVAAALGKHYVEWRLKAMPRGMGEKVVDYRHLDELASKLAPYMALAKKSEVLDLPAVMHVTQTVTLGKRAQAAYDAEVRRVKALREAGLLGADAMVAANTLLPQITSGFLRDPETKEIVPVGTEKEDALTEWLLDLAPGEPVVVFARFLPELDAIQRAAEAAGRTSCRLCGAEDSREAWVAGEYDVLAVQYKSGGAGVDLTRACYGLFFAGCWSPGDYEQMTGRLHRARQTRPVTFVHWVAEGTVDEGMARRLGAKGAVNDGVMVAVAGAPPDGMTVQGVLL